MRKIHLFALVVLAASLFAGSASAQVRLAMQGRIDAVNVVSPDGSALPGVLPIVTPGVRLVDDKLFVGLGLGFFDVEDDFGGVSLVPTATFDLIATDNAALSLGAMLLWASYGETTGGGDVTVSHIGVAFLAGIRGKLSEGLAIGTEWGWLLDSANVDVCAGTICMDQTTLSHGLVGTILFEGSIGL